MCDETSDGIGDIVLDNRVLFRACTRSNFYNSANQVQPEAFYKDGKNQTDGLSLALTQEAAIGTKKTYGVISITAGEVHAVRVDMKARLDLQTADHVLIRNMPCMDREAHERQEAEKVAAELAFKARVISTARTKKSTQ
jgi:hypothetical protein